MKYMIDVQWLFLYVEIANSVHKNFTELVVGEHWSTEFNLAQKRRGLCPSLPGGDL